jgi:hypothetical protein
LTIVLLLFSEETLGKTYPFDSGINKILWDIGFK